MVTSLQGVQREAGDSGRVELAGRGARRVIAYDVKLVHGFGRDHTCPGRIGVGTFVELPEIVDIKAL